MISNADVVEESTPHPDAALLADYASGQLDKSLGTGFFAHLMECEPCQVELHRLVHCIKGIRQLSAKREQRGFLRQSRTLISGVADTGCIVVPRGEAVCFHEELKDWRRVAVTWRNERIVISRAAWDACVPCGT